MDYKKLGRSGLKVSRLCLGTMLFGVQTDEKTSKRIIDMARDAGVNFIDTADVYNRGVTEEVVGRAIKRKRADWILATIPGPSDRQDDMRNWSRSLRTGAPRHPLPFRSELRLRPRFRRHSAVESDQVRQPAARVRASRAAAPAVAA